VCEFIDTGDDPHLRTLLAGRRRAPSGVWVPGNGAEIPQRWR
jgi:hypothetical protein